MRQPIPLNGGQALADLVGDVGVRVADDLAELVDAVDFTTHCYIILLAVHSGAPRRGRERRTWHLRKQRELLRVHARMLAQSCEGHDTSTKTMVCCLSCSVADSSSVGLTSVTRHVARGRETMPFTCTL